MNGNWKHKLHWWRLRTQWYRKKLRLTIPPYFINLEPTGFCNLHCKVCSYKQDRGKGYISLELAERAIENAAQFGVCEVRFFLAGEPLFHPHLGEMIAYAQKHGLRTMVHTNATILDQRRSEQLLESQLDALSLSFDGESAPEYESVRLGSQFEPTLQNILQFLELKRARTQKLPHVTLQVIKLYRGNSGMPRLSPEFKRRFDGLPVDRFLVLHPFAWPGQEPGDFVRPIGKKYFPCPLLWQSLSITWDGRILGCCGDLNGIITLGDIRQQSLEEIWNGPAMIGMRRQHVLGQHRSIPLCRHCDAVFVRVHPALRDLKELVVGKWSPL